MVNEPSVFEPLTIGFLLYCCEFGISEDEGVREVMASYLLSCFYCCSVYFKLIKIEVVKKV